MRLWNLTRGGAALQPLVLKGHKAPISHVVLSSDSQWLATGSEDATVRLWNLTKTDPSIAPIVLSGHTKRISACRFSPDARRLITASDEGTIQMWALEAGRMTSSTRLTGHTSYVFGLTFSPDGRWLMTAGGEGGARLWDLQAPKPESSGRMFSAHEGDVRPVESSGDSRWMVSLDANHTARLWNLRSENPAAQPLVLAGHEAGVGLLAISLDSHWLATAGASAATSLNDRVVRLWDLTRVDPSAAVLMLLGHERGVSSLTMSRNSRWLVTGSEDATVRLWDLGAENPAAVAIVLTGHDTPSGKLSSAPTAAASPAPTRTVLSASGTSIKPTSCRSRAQPRDAISLRMSGRSFSRASRIARPSLICRRLNPRSSPGDSSLDLFAQNPLLDESCERLLVVAGDDESFCSVCKSR